MNNLSCDLLIIGAGVFGLFTAYHSLNLNNNLSIIIIDSNHEVSQGASGYNSGILHSGIYYKPGSLKAIHSVLGNQMLKEFCKEHNIPINISGKVIVARNEYELNQLYDLQNRAHLNHVTTELVDEQKLQKIEQFAKTYKYAIYSPNTASVNPLEVGRTLYHLLKKKKVNFLLNCKYKNRVADNKVIAGEFLITTQKIVNAAGVYSEKIAKEFNFAKNYSSFPLKGTFLVSNNKLNDDIKVNIYPVPNYNDPFLGIHFVVSPKGFIKIGPTATPSITKNGRLLHLHSFSMDTIQTTSKYLKLLCSSNFDFRTLLFNEVKKLFPIYIKHVASELVQDHYKLNHFNKWSHTAVRPQLFDNVHHKLVDDFIVEYDKYSVHLLNTVSPGFTSSYSLCNKIVAEYL